MKNDTFIDELVIPIFPVSTLFFRDPLVLLEYIAIRSLEVNAKKIIVLTKYLHSKRNLVCLQPSGLIFDTTPICYRVVFSFFFL